MNPAITLPTNTTINLKMTTDKEDSQQRMRLSREVRIGELVALVLALSGVAAWYIDARIEPLKMEIRAIERAAAVQSLAQAEFKRELREDIRELTLKIDRLIEQRGYK